MQKHYLTPTMEVVEANLECPILVGSGTENQETEETVEVTRKDLHDGGIVTNCGDDNSKIINGHKFIDLGLPSGLLWAETNIGAATAADDGNYYAWGEKTTKESYDWSTYVYGSSRYSLKKYNLKDGKTVLEKEDDAAYVIWGTSCRMPTQAEFAELCDTTYCTWTWITKTNSSNENVEGYEVTSKKNGNSIFLPASGCRSQSGLYHHGSIGGYWSSTLRSYNTSNAYCLGFFSGYFGSRIRNYRYHGPAVRPVAEP